MDIGAGRFFGVGEGFDAEEGGDDLGADLGGVVGRAGDEVSKRARALR